MYPILILREEFVCLIVLLFLGMASTRFDLGRDTNAFRRLLGFAIVHIVLDIVTILTVNNHDSVPKLLNEILHVLFYLSAILYAKEICQYVVDRCYPELSKRVFWTMFLPIALYLLALPFLNIEYIPVEGTYSSSGSAAFCGFGIAGFYFVTAIVLIFINLKKLGNMTAFSLLPMLLILITSEIAQILVKELLFTGGAITIVTVGFFFSLENPSVVFERKMLTDALTGMGSRHSYEADMQRMQHQYERNPGQKYLFVFCDINDLRNVNNRFGHHEGDKYISLVATSLVSCLKKAKSMYRIGGDEFIVVYIDTPEQVAVAELKAAEEMVRNAKTDAGYSTGIAVGYAISGAQYTLLDDVVRAADAEMYRKKSRMKDMNYEAQKS